MFCMIFFLYYFYKDDNLVIIGGRDRTWKRLSNVELIHPSSNNYECELNDLNVEVTYHSSVLSSSGEIISCGGTNSSTGDNIEWNPFSKCQTQTSAGKTRYFPPMKYNRIFFEMAQIDGILYAIGGWPSYRRIETINIKSGKQWKEEPKMPFRVWHHCVVTINTNIVVTGGWSHNGTVSKNNV